MNQDQQKTTLENALCIDQCEQFYDYQECRKLCLSISPHNTSLYRRALLQAERDGLNELHRQLFAAGAVWGWTLTLKNRR